jgi:hypothetical protein
VSPIPVQPAPPPIARPVSAPAPPPPAAPGAPLSPEHLRQLRLARQRGRSIRRAAGVATFHGWTFALCAGLSLLVGLLSLTSLLIGLALAVVAYNEFTGARLLRSFDERGPRRLGSNQLGLCGVLIVYAGWSIYSTLTAPSPLEAAFGANGVASLGPDNPAAPLLSSIQQLQTTVTLAVFGGLIVASLVFQGGTAWYYFSRARHLRAYVAETPQWVIELDRTTAT